MAKICVPVCVSQLEEMPGAIRRAEEYADIVELRLDCLKDASGVSSLLDRSFDRQLILTMRSGEQGGGSQLDAEGRKLFWSSLGNVPANAFLDLELDLIQTFSAGDPLTHLGADWAHIICSHHDFQSVPRDLNQIVQAMAATPAGIIKIAVQANDATDCIPIFRLLDLARESQRQIIAIAMGEAGVITRILGPSRGAFLTYGSLDDESATASGQINARELREVYRVDRLDRDTDIFGIIGNPVSHSLSPFIHNVAFGAANLNSVYVPIEVHDAAEFMRRMAHPKSREFAWNLRGLSVTAPHKLTVIQYLDWIDPAAKEIGAVNTIVVQKNQLLGYNTDAAGFMGPLRHTLGSLSEARVGIIGNGGAARACLWALRKEGAKTTILARSPEKGRLLSEAFGASCMGLDGSFLSEFDVVVNATPLGSRGALENMTPATADQLRGVRLVYDLVYNPSETRFMREGRDAGCAVLGGIEMLIAQAIEQFKLWTGVEPDEQAMRAAAERGLKV